MIKPETHSEELGLLRPRYILVASRRNIKDSLTLSRMGFFGPADGLDEGKVKRPLVQKICHTYPTMMKLGIIIPYPKKIQKIYELHDTTLEIY